MFGDRRAEAFAAWRRFIERLAENRPTVLVFEDLHWADDALVEFIEHLAAWVADVPLLVLCTARPEFLERRPGWSVDSTKMQVISLAPLSAAENSAMPSILYANNPSAYVNTILDRVAGKPEFGSSWAAKLLTPAKRTEPCWISFCIARIVSSIG